MPEIEVLPQQVRQAIEELQTAEIVLGISTHNSAAMIEHVVRTAEEGLLAHFPSAKSVIVNCDGGSKDGTPEIAAAAADRIPVVQAAYPVYPVERLGSPYHGVPGKSSALRTIFEVATQLGAACAVVDADGAGMTPDWMDRLVRPVLNLQFDFVAPSYTRHQFDGSFTSGILYPMMRALYGKRVRYPLGADFCFSPRLMKHLLSQNAWEGDAVRYSVDLWVTTQALSGGYRVCQAVLGPKPRSRHDAGADLSTVLCQLLGAMFVEMERHLSIWQKVRGSEPVASHGEPVRGNVEPVVLDVARMIESFRLGQQNLQDIWWQLLPPATLLELKRMARRPDQEFRMRDEVWARIVYDFSLAHHLRVMSRDHLLRALAPLYLAWVASFALETEGADVNQAEARIEQLCLRYEAEKPYLISRWRWPDRFNP